MSRRKVASAKDAKKAEATKAPMVKAKKLSVNIVAQAIFHRMAKKAPTDAEKETLAATFGREKPGWARMNTWLNENITGDISSLEDSEEYIPPAKAREWAFQKKVSYPNYGIVMKPIICDGAEIPEYVGVFADSGPHKGQYIEVLTPKYTAVKNSDIIEPVLKWLKKEGIGYSIQYTAYGNAENRIFFYIKLDDVVDVGGEEIAPMIVLRNSFDSSYAVSLATAGMMTKANTLLGFGGFASKRRHIGDVDSWIAEVKESIKNIRKNIYTLREWAVVHMSDSDFEVEMSDLLPTSMATKATDAYMALEGKNKNALSGYFIVSELYSTKTSERKAEEVLNVGEAYGEMVTRRK